MHLEVLESAYAAVAHVGDILHRRRIAVAPALGKIRVFLLIEALVIADNAVLAPQVAGDTRLVFADTVQRAAVQTAAGHFRLLEAAVGRALQRFGAGLARVGVLVRLAMVEDVPLPVQFRHAAMGVAEVVRAARLVGGSVLHVQVAQVHQRSAVAVAGQRMFADGIAQFVVVLRRVHKNVLAVDFADAACLEEGVSREFLRRVVVLLRENQLHFVLDGQHVLFQFHADAAGIAEVMEAAHDERHLRRKAGVEVDAPVVIHQRTGVERELIPGAAAPLAPVGITDMTVVFIRTLRLITDRHAHASKEIIGIIEVIAPVHALHHVRCEQQADAQLVQRVLFFLVDNTLVAPRGQIVHRRGVAHIVVDAEDSGVKAVVRAVHIHPIAEDMRLTVRDVLPCRQIRVEYLFHLFFSLPSLMMPF